MAKATHTFDADELLALAMHDLEKERLEGALEKFKAAEGRSECPPLVYAELGRLYSKLKLFDRAKSMFQRYLQQQPAALTELFQLGMAHFESGEGSEALDKWNEVLKLAPAYPPAMFFTSFQYAKQGDLIRAHEGCQQLLASVASDNLYFGRAQELMQRIDTDPAYLQARQRDAGARRAH